MEIILELVNPTLYEISHAENSLSLPPLAVCVCVCVSRLLYYYTTIRGYHIVYTILHMNLFVYYILRSSSFLLCVSLSVARQDI
jgi:hypothetical protein